MFLHESVNSPNDDFKEFVDTLIVALRTIEKTESQNTPEAWPGLLRVVECFYPEAGRHAGQVESLTSRRPCRYSRTKVPSRGGSDVLYKLREGSWR